MAPKPSDVLTPAEIAREFGINPLTLREWTKKPHFCFPEPFKPGEGKLGVRPLYWGPTVRRWFAAQRYNGAGYIIPQGGRDDR